MDLTKVLLESLGNGGLSQIASSVGMDENKTSSAMGALVPVLLGAMSNNAKSGGAEGLLGALDSDHDGSILDDIGGFLGGNNSSRAANGSGILKHILGDKTETVSSGLAGKLGVDAGAIGKLLPILAPMIMGYLGKQKRSAGNSGFSSDGIGDLLGQLAGGSKQEDDGLDIGDIFDMVGGLAGGNSGGGGLLGGLLKNVLGK
jgi:hypothetical protein